MIEAHLSLLLVLAPLLAAPIVALMPGGRAPWLTSLLVTWLGLGLAIWQIMLVLEQGVIVYSLGGWAAPTGIEYRVDMLNAFVALIITSIAACTLPYALHSVEREIPRHQHALFYAAFLLCITGMLGITQTGDVFNLFVFLEISSLSSYALISMGRDRRALTAAYQYLIMGTIGASFLLIGIGLLYAETGTLNMMDLQQRLPAQFEQRTLQTGFAFIVVGIALKLAMLPLHLWLPNAYTYAPSVVTIFLAATATKVAVYVMIRFLFTVFGAEFVFSDMHLDYLLLPLAAIAILSASLVAIFQENTKRMLAYSSVAQIGYLLLGLGMATTAGLNATLVHLFNHAIMKAALFMSLGAIAYRIGSTQLADLAGLGKQMPLTMAAFVIGGLSLVGVPLTAGFFSKWVLIEAAMEKYQWWLVIVIVVGSLLTLVYIWRVVETIYLKPSSQPHTHAEAPASLLIPMGILLLVNIYMGVQAGTGGAYTLSAAQQILGVLP